MEKRINLQQLEPKAYKAMFGLEQYLASSDLDKHHKELIKIRASQINGCAFCINMHTKDALKLGETPKRIFLLNAWREVPDLYSEEERAILALTEEITHISNGGVSSETYKKAASLFDENYLAQIIIAASVINTWNRFAISTHMPPTD